MKITYTDKNKQAEAGSPARKWRDIDANEVKDSVNAAYDDITTLDNAVFYENTDITWVDGFVTSAGALNSVSPNNYRVSQFIPVSFGDRVDVSLSGTSSIMTVSAYREEDQASFITGSLVNVLGSSSPATDVVINTIVVPAGVNYLRFSKHGSTPNTDIYVRKRGLETKTDVSVRLRGYSETKRRIFSRRKPLFCFVWDGMKETDPLVYSIFNNYGLKAGFALRTNPLDMEKVAFYQQAYLNGFSILSQGTMGANDETAMSTSHKIIQDLSFVNNGWVTTSSVLDPADLPLVKKYYGYAFTQAPPAKGVLPASGFDETIDPCEMQRIGLESWNMDETNQAAIKSLIDHAIANDLLIVFYGHEIPSIYFMSDGTTTKFSEADLRGVLEYLIEKRDSGQCEILSPDEAIYQYYSGIIF